MFKSKSFLLSSATLMMFLTLSAPVAHAMEDESSEESVEKVIISDSEAGSEGEDSEIEAHKAQLTRKATKIEKMLDDPTLREKVYDKIFCLEERSCIEENFPDLYKKIKDKAETEKDPYAQFCLGRLNLEQDDLDIQKNAVANLKLAADQNFVLAQYLLGRLYLFEKKTFVISQRKDLFKDFKEEKVASATNIQDDQERVRWLTRAAEQGDQPAQLELAYLYQTGINRVPDRKLAAHWFSKAAEGAEYYDKREAQYELAQLYRIGIDGNPNPEEALKLLTALSESHPDRASFAALYEMHKNGEGTPANSLEALKNLMCMSRTASLTNDQKEFLKERLQIDRWANRWRDKAYSFSSLASISKTLKSTITHDPLPVPFDVASSTLFKFTEKLMATCNLLEKTSRGFMITVCKPSNNMRAELKANPHEFFSLDTVEDTEYFTIGTENSAAAKTYIDFMRSFSLNRKEAMEALQTIKATYETNFKRWKKLSSRVLELAYIVRAQGENVRQYHLRKFEDKSETLRSIPKTEMQEDYNFLLKVEETLNETTGIIEGYVRKGLANRNADFFDMYDERNWR